MSTHDDSRPNHSVPITILAVLAWIGAFCVLTSASAQEAAPEFCSYHSAVNTAAAVQLEQAYDLICEQLNLDNHHPSSEEVELLNHIRDRIDGYGSPAAEVLEQYAGMNDCPDDGSDEELERLKLTMREFELEHVQIQAELLLPPIGERSVLQQNMIDEIIYARRALMEQIDLPRKSARANLFGRLLLVKKIE